MRENDFQTVLLGFINSLGLSIHARLDYLEEAVDDLVINQIPGGKVDKEYMDGTQEISLPFEIMVKSKDNQMANDTIWRVTNALSAFDINLPSKDNSYDFLSISVNRPAVNGRDEQGFYYYSMDVVATIVIERKEINK